MFKGDIAITGKHAYYMKVLSDNDNPSERFFNRYIDVYINAAIIGFIYGEKEDVDKDSEYKEETARIFYDAINREKQNLDFIYRIIMLLEDGKNLSKEERIERAFKDDIYSNRKDKKEANLELFNNYVRGGISFLYEKLNGINIDDRITNIKEFVEDFNSEFFLRKYLEDIDYEEDVVY